MACEEETGWSDGEAEQCLEANHASTSLWVMGRLGDSEGRGCDAELLPRRLSSLGQRNVRQVSAGPFHAAVCTQGGDVYAWGANFFGQLGRTNEVGTHINSSSEMAQKFEDIGGFVVDAMDITVRSHEAQLPRGPGEADHRRHAELPIPMPLPIRSLALIKAYTGHTTRQVRSEALLAPCCVF